MIKIYGKQSCPFCEDAVEYCRTNNINFVYTSIDNDTGLVDMIKSHNQTTVPCIFSVQSDGTDTLIGGYNDLVEWHYNYSLFD